jgi:hypothetical protein
MDRGPIPLGLPVGGGNFVPSVEPSPRHGPNARHGTAKNIKVRQEPYQRNCVSGKHGGFLEMPSSRAEYYRRQANICLRLSLAAVDDEACTRLLAMARHFKSKADAAERESEPPPSVAELHTVPTSAN